MNLDTSGADLWKAHSAGSVVCVTTNGVTDRLGRLVMGAGVALQASRRFPGLAAEWGKGDTGDVLYDPVRRLLRFPTKHDWRDKACGDLIARSAGRAALALPPGARAVIARPGMGLGGLTWAQVRPALAAWEDDYRFVVLLLPEDVG